VDAETGLTRSIRLGVPDDIAKRDGELGSLLFGKKLGERRFLRL
jgi:hypothetical protein